MLDKVIRGDFPFSDGRYHGCPWDGKITLGGDDGRLTWWTGQMSLL